MRIDPGVAIVMAVMMTVAIAMVRVGVGLRALERHRPPRCAACRRILVRGRRCPCLDA